MIIHEHRRVRRPPLGGYRVGSRVVAIVALGVIAAGPAAMAFGIQPASTSPPVSEPVNSTGTEPTAPVTSATTLPDGPATSTVDETGAPMTSEGVASTAPVDTTGETVEPGTTAEPPESTGVDPVDSSIPGSSIAADEPCAAQADSTVDSLPGSTSVDGPGPTEPAESASACVPTETDDVTLTPTINVFPDGDGNFTNDEGEAVVAGEASGLSIAVRVTNSAPNALSSMIIDAPAGSESGEWAKVDVELVRVQTPAGTSGQLTVRYADGTIISRETSPNESVPVASVSSVTAIRLTVTGVLDGAATIAPGATAGLEVHGTLNGTVGPDDLADGASPGVELCALVAGRGRPDQAEVPGGGACDVVTLGEGDQGGIVVLAAAQGAWTVTGANPSWSGTAEIPATAFPPATFETNSNTPTVPSGASAFLGASTPFGTAFESTQNNPYLSLRSAAGGSPSVTTFTFDSPTPVGWGFAAGDIDADFVTVSASGPSGPLTAAELGFQGSFNYCASAPVPPTCDSPPFADVPGWDPTTFTLRGNIGDTDGATGWFRPTVPVTSLVLTFGVQSGIPIFQLWFAAPTSIIAGTVTESTPGGPVAAPEGTVLALLTAAGDPVLDGAGNPVTTTTAADGTYAFGAVASAAYLASVAPPSGYQVVGPSTQPADSTTGDVSGVDFVIQLAAPPTSTTTTTTTTPSTTTTVPPITTTLPPTSTRPPSTTTSDPGPSSATGATTTSTVSGPTTDPGPSSTTAVGSGAGELTTTTVPGAPTNPSAATLPQTGAGQNGIVTIAFGLVLAGLGLMVRRRSSNRPS